jgi:serine protease
MRTGSVVGLSAVICLAFTSNAAPTNPPSVRTALAPAPIYRIIVKLRSAAAGGPTAARQQRQATPAREAVSELAARNQLTLLRARSLLPGLQVIDLLPQSGDSLPAALARLRADAAVEFAEPDQQRHIAAVPNDPQYLPTPGSTGQWYLNDLGTTPSAVDAIDAWTTTTGSTGLVIADIDTGVRFDHPDLLRAGAGGRLLPGYSFVSSVLAANDGAVTDSPATGANATWDADASDPGDWISAADTQFPEFSQCPQVNSTWHGTRVVGIMGAITNNNIGIAGLTWSGWILPVRALGKCGGADSDIETAMLWAAGMQVEDDLGNQIPLNPYPANIINLSLGAAGACPQSYQSVIAQLTGAGVTVIAAAGNEGGPVDAPGNCTGIIAVAGLRQDGTKVGFSSLGPQIALSAPGGNCVNAAAPCLFSVDTTTNTGLTTPGPTPAADTYTNQNNYNVGTSFATPLVSGIAGLMLSVNGNLLPSQMQSRLQEGVKLPFPVSSDNTVPTCHVPANSSDVQTAECNCTTQTCGAGMANANGAVNAALRPIAALQALTPVTGGQSVTLDASLSGASCGSSISGYAWSVTSGNGNIAGPTTHSTARVVAPTSGTITVQVVVTDNMGRTDTAQMVVSSTAATTTAPASAGAHACLSALTPTLPITVAVSPSSATLQAGQGSQAFAAALTSTANQVVSWQVNSIPGGNSTVGTVSSAGVYTPPPNQPSPSTVSVMAISAQDPAASGFAGVTISAPVSVSIAPLSAFVMPGGTQAFVATVLNAGTNTSVVWQVNGIVGGNATVGTVSGAGLYTAPATIPSPATVMVTAVSTYDGTRSASAAVAIANVAVSVTPSVASVATGASKSFTAAVANSSNSAVTWQVNGITGGNATVGTISSSGVYQAPTSVPSPAVVTVSAISVANSTRSGSAQVTVTGSSGGSSSGSGGGGGGGGGAMGWPLLLLLAALALPAVAARRRPRMRGGALLAMTLALLGASAGAHADSRWVAGQHYFLINPAQPTGLPAGKVQVIEIFSYACPGCNRFYPVADRLRASLPPYAVMEYLAASFRPDEDWPMFQRAYVTAQQMGIDERTHDAMFDAVWKSGELAVFDPATQHARHPPPSIADAAQFYAKAAGVKPEAFLATAGSFGVDVKVREADERIRNYAIGETPSIVVNGKYRLNPVSAGGYEETIDLVKWLVSQEAPPGSKH